MRTIRWALLVWSALGIVGIWAADAASHAGSAGPGQAAGLLPSAWVLFEIWAIGFVLLGAIRRVPRVVLAWTAIWIVLFAIWALDPARSVVGQGPGSGSLLDLKPPDWALFDCWAIGLGLLVAALLLARLWRRRRPSSG